MTRTKLHNNFLQNNREENRNLYSTQKTYGVSLSRKIKNRYYENVNAKSVIDNKVFLEDNKISLVSKNCR